jgi:D-beta-D-heptose 7-phosphate kinase/D-beta-D-heptose 1-phosphate adenosyltransferase
MLVHSEAALRTPAVAKLPDEGFRKTRVLVIGDVMLDRYISGNVTRISPEAPVPVLAVEGEKKVAGGAANVALNVAGLGAETIVAGVVGQDANGSTLRGVLEDSGINTGGIVTDGGRMTTCKTRVICGNHQIVRLDEENAHEIPKSLAEQLLERITTLFRTPIHAVVVSDYAKGTLSVELTRLIVAACSERKIPLFIDPKRSNYLPYSRAFCITPNLKEFNAAVTGMSLEADHWVAAAQNMRRKLRCNSLLITQGAEGMTLIAPKHIYHFPALAEEVFDVSGAGDTVIATLATAVGAGLSLLTAVQLSNMAASVVVRRAGTTPVHWEELRRVAYGQAANHADTPVRERFLANEDEIAV